MSNVRVVPRQSKSAGAKQVRTEKVEGGKVYVIDAGSKTFGADLLEVFRKKVRAARRENVKIVGSPDRVPAGR